MVDYLIIYGITLIVFFVVDMVWLGVIAKKLYQREIGHLLKENVNWIAAIIFYLLFIGGLVIFVLHPALNRGEFSYALLYGGLFGLMTYATYDLTNLATLKDWPLRITLIDLAWGTSLGILTSTLAFLVLQMIL